MSTRTLVKGSIAAVLAAAIGLYVSGIGPGGRDARAAEIGAQPGQTVTLVTGDRVTLPADGGGGPAIRPAAGRGGMKFAVSRVGGHLHVVPVDALALLNGGRLDPRLFDVTGLLALGFGDDRRTDLPLIVNYTGDQPRLTGSAKVVRRLPAIGGAAMRAGKGNLAAFWDGATTAGGTRSLRTGIGKVWLDGMLKPTLDVSVPQIGAPAAWQAGLTGAGVTVAVLDTGVDATHPDLAGRVVAEANFTDDADGLDRVGHGTHVASTIAGSGAASDGRYKGVAPDARLLDGKVCTADGCYESAVVAGMEWAVAGQHAKVVNLSLGHTDEPGLDPTEEAVRRLTEQYGALFVVAAGNAGADETVGSPASADEALAVGAVDKSDALAGSSSRGPRVGDAALKPDLTAPGVDITAARSSRSDIGEPGRPYVTLSGTSMAAPHVAGAAALLAQQHPDWSPERLKATLMSSAKPAPGAGVFAQGAGRVDVARAVAQPVTTEPASVSFGRELWPHTDDEPVVRTLTYRNGGPADLTLALTLEGAPAGMFRLDRTEVGVPAGGQAQVTLTSDTRTGSATGQFGGYVTATATGVLAHTPFGVDLEPESYDVTLSHLDRTGAATGAFSTALVNLDSGEYLPVPPSPDGTATLRLRAGKYLLRSIVSTPQSNESSLLVQPVLDPSADRRVSLDARLAQPVDARPDRAGAAGASAAVIIAQQIGTFGFTDMLWGNDFRGISTARIGPDRDAPGFSSAIVADYADPGRDGDFTNSPYVYHLAWSQPGTLPTGFRRTVADRDLAKVIAAHAAAAPDSFSVASANPAVAGGGVSYGFPLRGPFTQTEYYTSAPGLRWSSDFIAVADDQFQETLRLSAGPRELAAGRTYRETWNQGVFGPSLAAPPEESWFASRTGDRFFLLLPQFGDSAGHRGFSTLTAERYTLYRDGTKLAELTDPSGEPGWAVPLPAERSAYRLEAEARRTPGMPLSSHVTTAWTFRSGHVTGDEPVRLPLSVVRFAPALDEYQHAPAGRPFDLPVTIEQQPGSAAARTARLTVEVSYDDRTWQPVPLTPAANGWTGHLDHPRAAGFVSLRSRAVDTKGNTVEQTVTHAYETR